MENKKESFKEFKKKIQHNNEELLSILTINPITSRLTYFIKKKNLNISPNTVTLIRLLFLSSLTIFILFLAPVLNLRIFYLFVPILIYLMIFSDDLDGCLARGLNKKSKSGAFLDSIADRFFTIILFVFLFSLGSWNKDSLLVIGSIFLFALKTFHMMIITKIYYYNIRKDISPEKLFSGKKAMNYMGINGIIFILNKINKILKVKRWGVTPGGYERAFITIIVPSLLLFFNFEVLAGYLGYLIIILYVIFFLIRINDLLKDYAFPKK